VLVVGAWTSVAIFTSVFGYSLHIFSMFLEVIVKLFMTAKLFRKKLQ
jgi:hypothetical protein